MGGVRAQDAARPKKIMFWAGPKEHGAPGRHEYERDLTELAWQLEHATNLHGVKTVVKVVTKPPRDISELDDADALVIFGNGAWLKTETGILFPQDQDTDWRTYDAEHTEWLNKLDAVIKQRKMGLAIFHYTMWVDNWVGKRFLTDWFGGHWIPYSSHNPVDTWTVSPLKVRHPILNGVQPWTYRDEMFSRYFLYTIQAHRIAAGHARHRQQWRPRSGVLGLQPCRWRPLLRLGRIGLPRQHAQRRGLSPIPAQRHHLDRRTGRAAGASLPRRRRRTIRRLPRRPPAVDAVPAVVKHRDVDRRRAIPETGGVFGASRASPYFFFVAA